MPRARKSNPPPRKQSRIAFQSSPVIDLTADDDAAAPGSAASRHAAKLAIPVQRRLAPIFKKGKRPIRLLVIRHAHTQGYHIPNTPLSADGVQQAMELGATLAAHSFQAVIVSPLMRAMQTACIALGQYESVVTAQRAGAAEEETPPRPPLTATLPPSLASLTRALGNHGAAKHIETRAVLAESAEGAATRPLSEPAASQGGGVPVIVAPVVREALGTLGDVGQAGDTACERLATALTRRSRTERDRRVQAAAVPADKAAVDPGTATPWVNDALLHSQLGQLPWGWWLDKTGKPPPTKAAAGGGGSDQGIGLSMEPRTDLLARVGLFRKALARLPPHVTCVAVISHNHFLRAFSGTRKGWYFTQLKEETIEV